MSLGKKFRNIAAAFLMVVSTVTPMGGALLRNTYAAVGNDAPANSKKIRSNGDGTYTIALSVTGATESSTTTEATKANVILVLDTSTSMINNNTTYNGTRMTRLAAEKRVLTDDNGIIDSMLSQNVAGDPIKSDIIEIAVANFGTRGTTAQSFTTSASALKNTINGLSASQGTNWEEGLMRAQELATSIKTSQPNEEVYVIFLTDGEPTTHYNDYTVNTNYAQEWAQANDNARAIVTAGHHFYGIFTWGSNNSSHYLSSLVQYAYTGSGNSNTALNPTYADYFSDATDTSDLIDALTQIVNDITTGVGYTNVEMTDGVTSMTASSVKATAGGDVTGLKYYRSGGSYGTADPDNGNYGTEWAEAPHATINEDGEVDWDLGSAVLENGVTYTVTFVVWPKQDSLDLVADLNNGKVSYESLTPEQKAQISVSGGKYTLKTNTDYPTVTYSTVTTTTVDGQTTTTTSDPVTINMTNPDPVALAEEKIAIEKKWDDTMDPTQREEVKSVKLFLKVDNDYYDFDASTEDVDGIVLTEGDDGTWTADSIAIAPGVMISNASNPAYDSTKTVSYGGKTYSILEAGHTYVFSEENINNHFELTAYEHHPMIVDGEVKSVTFTYDDAGNITGISNIYDIDTLSATNTIKGGINIEKRVVDENGATVDSKDKFTAVVHLQNEDGSDYSYDYRIYYGQNNPEYSVSERTCTDAEGNVTVERDKHRSCHIYDSGTITQDLYVGDTIRVVNVDAGTRYYVEEPNTPTGYEFVSVDNKISVGTPNNFGAYTSDQTVTEGGKTYYVMQGNSAWQSVITNKYTFGSLKISKTVDGAATNYPKNFEFTVSLYDAEGNEIKDWSYDYTGDKSGTLKYGETVSLAGGEEITIAGLPEGATYKVTEAEMDGYTTAKTGDEGTIVKNETAEADFTNTYSLSGHVKIEAKKQFNNWPYGDTFTFNLTGEGQNLTDTIENANDTAVFEFDVDAAGTYVYTISETGTLRSGVSQTSGDIEVTIVATEDEAGDGTLNITRTYTSDNENVITNTYEATGTVQFSATKLLTGRDWANQESFAFTLYGSDEAYNLGDALTTANSSTDDEHAVVFDEIEYTFGAGDVGKTYYYVIRETSNLEGTGLSNETGDLHVKVEIEDNHDGTLKTTVTYENGQVVENVYTATGETKLKATKVLSGRSWKEGESYTFELKDASGDTIATKTVSANGEITFEDADFVSADKILKFDQDDVLDGPITLNYTITETGNLAANGLTKSDDIPVTVTVSDAGNGKLKVETEYDNNDTITNTYTATGSVTLEATKKFAGAERDWTETFDFTLSGNGVSETKQVTKAEPKATFTAINYTLADAGKTYTYTIAETDPGLAGVTPSGALTVEVAIVDNGDGTLTATPTYKDNLKEITNTYVTESTNVTLHVDKKIEDQSNSNVDGVLDGTTFDFTLSNADGYSDTKRVTTENLEGGVDFDVITYTAAGTYTYTLKEVEGNADGFTYDTNEYTVVVTVVDDPETATLSASVTIAGANTNSTTITNIYKATATSIQFEVTKTLNGMNEGVDPVDFDFTLSGADGEIETITINGAGKKKFSEISYDQAGTYEYTVVEKNGGAGGYSYDGATYTITVVVSDEGGALKATPTIKKDGESASSITFENNYSAKGIIVLQTKKELEGRNWLEGETHTFVLKDNAGNTVDTQDVTSEGLISFREIEYTKAGTYTYTVEEVLGEEYQDGSLVAPTDPVTVTVTVTDDGKGNLTATPSYGEEAPTITNTYTATGSVTIDVTKALEGRDWLDGETFTFALYDNEGNQIGESQTVNESNKTASFTVEYTQEDTKNSENGEVSIQYTIKEISEMPANVEQEYPDGLTVTVSLKDDGHGTIEATADQEDGYTFTNTYEADPVDVTLHVDKEIDNQSNSENIDDTSFTFALIDNEGNTVEEKILSLAELENGVDFSTITYDTPGVYNYTLKEIEGSANGFTYDTTEYAVVITVEDHPDTTGALTAKVEINGNETSSLTITNIYKAEPTTAYIEIEKVLTGAENVPEVATFEFTLTGEGENKKTTIQGSGSGSFDVINYEQAGTYTYTVEETNSGAAGYTYDDTEYTVIVTVVDNGGKLEATIKYMIGEEEAEIAKFENSYEATPITDYEVIVNKMLEGRDLEEGEFEFELVDTNGEVIATGTNDADGNVVFSGINFEEVGEYNFLVREIVDENRGEIDFDTNEYEVTIVVADNGEGELVIESDTSSEVIFKNKYNEPGKGENPRTDDDILSVVAMLIVSTIGLIGAVLFGKRSKEEATVEA